jgi:predicted acetyltransferase
MEIREVREDELEAAYYLGSQAFGQGSRDTSRMKHPDRLARPIFGVWDDTGLQAVVAVIPYQIYLGAEVTVPMGGIASVSSLPASRGKGYAGSCLKYSLERMHDAGQVVSTLFPFSFEYYERFGWAWTGVSRTYETPTRILRPAAETEYVRAAGESDRTSIYAAYAEFARRYRGPVARTEQMWNQVLNSSDTEYRYTYLFERDGRVEGYLTYLGGKREQTRLREMIVLTARARRGLLGLLRRHEMQIDKFKWEAPEDDQLWSILMHSDIETRISPTTMGRVVDVPAALKAWRPDKSESGRVFLAVTDTAAPWNQGTWRIEFEGGEVTAVSTNDAPQLSLDIKALSQAYFGTPSVAEVRAAGHIDVHDEAGFRTFETLLAGPPMWMNDSF